MQAKSKIKIDQKTDVDTQTHLKQVSIQKLLHTDAFTHRRFYTETLLHIGHFTQTPFYAQTLLHTDPVTHR